VSDLGPENSRATAKLQVNEAISGDGTGAGAELPTETDHAQALPRTVEGAAGVGAGVLEGSEGDHEGADAPNWIAGSDGDRGSCDVVLISVISKLGSGLRPAGGGRHGLAAGATS